MFFARSSSKNYLVVFWSSLGFRARDESRKLRWGDIQIQQDSEGREMLVWLCERSTKTRKGQENGHRRSFQPKIYATDTNRCPVKYYKLFESHRPAEMNTPDSPFFLAVRHGNRRENSHIWYKKSLLGKNAIGQFMSKAADKAGLQRSGAKVCNHSVRKASISRLLDANTPEIFVSQLSGHKSLQSLQSYKTASTCTTPAPNVECSQQNTTSIEYSIKSALFARYCQ